MTINPTLPLKIYTLGGLSIQRGDQPVIGFISRKVEALLVYLAFDPREYPREALAELLWTDHTQVRAMANLRTTLSNLQSQLTDYLIVTRQSVMINPETSVWIDALALSQMTKLTNPPLTRSAVRILESAVDLYKGEFLAGFHIREAIRFEQWIAMQSTRLRESVCETLYSLINDAIQHETYESGIKQARQWLILDPLQERAYRSLMLMLAKSGQRSNALTQYETCVRLLQQELGVMPEAETTQLFKQIEAEQIRPAVPKIAPTIRLPTPPTPFIERPRELTQILNQIDNPDCHLISIVGPGGIGKTRLAIQAAANRSHAFRDGTYFISLVSVESADFLPLEMASVLRYTFKSADQPRQELIDYLSNQNTLLVLDNFEHIAGGAGLITDILASAADVTIVVTSREWLNLPQESVIPVGGMEVPIGIQDDNGYSAVQLFTACATRIRPDFSLANNLSAVIKICQFVEGMPLSIELAAGWLRVIPAAEIMQQININFLATASRNIPERHRSVRAVFDYSWKLLTPVETHAMMWLSVFKGPFDRAAASQVADASLPVLALLLEKSLIRLVDDQYYDIHELMRQYAYDHLVEAQATSMARDAHLHYYGALTSNPDSRIHGQQQTTWLDRLDREHDNLRTALSWALEHDSPAARQAGLDLGASLWEFWLMRGHITEGRQWLEQLLIVTKGTISIARGSVTQGAGYLAHIQGENDRAEALHQEGLAMRRTLNDKAGMGGSLNNLGVIAWSRGDFTAARNYYEQALAARREANYTLGMASVLNNLTLLLQDQGEYADAIAYAEQALAQFTILDDLQGKAYVLLNLGAMTYDQGDWTRAQSIQEEGLALARQLGDSRIIGGLLQNLGHTAASLGNYPLAHAYLAESLSRLNDVGDKTQLALVKRTMARLAMLESRFEDAESLLAESLSILKAVGAVFYVGQALTVYGDLYRLRGQWGQAEESYHQALAILFKTKNQQPAIEALYQLARVAFANDEAIKAVTLLKAADGFAERLRIRFPGIFEAAERATLQSRLTAEAFTQAAQKSAAMSISDIAAYIGLQGDPPPDL